MQINITKGYTAISYYAPRGNIRVKCPDCGSGGASSYPCWCHNCNSEVLMLPAQGSRYFKNWNEVFKPNPNN